MSFYEKHKKIFLSLMALSSFLFMLSYYLTPITTNDFWIQLKVGQLIKENFEIPKTILFAFTPETNKPFVAHEWLPSLFFSLFYDIFGYNFMIILKFLLYSFSFLLAFLLSFRISKKPLISFFVATLCLYTVNYRSFLRPEAFSYIFFLLQINLLWVYLEKKSLKFLLYYVIINILWVNSHGSFLLSLGLPGLLACSLLSDKIIKNFLLRKKEKILTEAEIHLIATSFICLFTSLINPLGYKLLVHSYHLSQNELLKQTIFEWKPMLSPTVMRSSIFNVFLIFISFSSSILVFKFMKLRTFSVALLLIFTFLAFEAQRHLSFLAVASVWPLSLMLRDFDEKSRFSTVLSIVLVLVPLGLAFKAYENGNTVRTKPGFYHSARMPEETINYIEEKNLQGNTLNTYSLGGQLLFHFYPEIKIGIDSRVDAYGVEYARKYRNLIYGQYEPLRDFIRAYSIKNIIVNYPAYRSMQKKGSLKQLSHDGWKLTHKSSKVVILERNI